jgi:general secretion pathway protein I
MPRAVAHGFTLIEVLIALVIAATALALGFGTISGSAQRLTRVEEAMLTRWAIDNVVNDLSLRGERVAPGRHEFVETMLGRSFTVTAVVERAEGVPALKLEISVADAAEPGIELERDSVELLYAQRR